MEVKQTLTIEITPHELKKLIAEGVKSVVVKMQEEKQEYFISPKKAAKLLDCSVRTLDNYPDLKKYRNGGLVRYKKGEVLAFLKGF